MSHQALFYRIQYNDSSFNYFTNVLIFMHKYQYFRKILPPLVSNVISPDAPKYDHSNLDSEAWMANHFTGKFRHVVSFKGPLFYLNYMPKILEQFQKFHKNSINMPLKIFKRYVKSFALAIQSCGSLEEWEGRNTPLYYVPGLPREHRKNIPKVLYKNFEWLKFESKWCLVKNLTTRLWFLWILRRSLLSTYYFVFNIFFLRDRSQIKSEIITS